MAEEFLNEADEAIPPDFPPRDGDFKMPSVEEILKALEGMDGISEDDKESLRESLLNRNNQENPFANAVQDKGFAPDLLVLFLLLTLVLFIFVFFGYKLYKSLTDRERRKEEKRKQKQQKKKK